MCIPIKNNIPQNRWGQAKAPLFVPLASNLPDGHELLAKLDRTNLRGSRLTGKLGDHRVRRTIDIDELTMDAARRILAFGRI
ncbi:MAG: hypothetical protein ACI82A_002658 [Candidatus Azotimanducaceae bacterium]|jgi:hypothetical protein